MAALPEAVAQLVVHLSHLPGIGPRTAERLALYLVQAEVGRVEQLAKAMLESRHRIRFCERCGALAEAAVCSLCGSGRRDESVVCVVETPVDVLSLERSGTFRGLYHVLGGKISPVNGIEPEDLSIAALEARLAREPIRELVIALSTDVEGDATSYYLAKRLARPGLVVSRIAYGLPAGSGLEFADEVTLSRALEGRREIT